MSSLAYRLAQGRGETLEIEPKFPPVKDPSYLAFIHKLSAVDNRQIEVEAAHLSTANKVYGHMGRAKGKKASDRFALPLSPQGHRKQHSMNEIAFWKELQINPYALANALYSTFKERGDTPEAVWLCEQIIARAKLGD